MVFFRHNWITHDVTVEDVISLLQPHHSVQILLTHYHDSEKDKVPFEYDPFVSSRLKLLPFERNPLFEGRFRQVIDLVQKLAEVFQIWLNVLALPIYREELISEHP